jgi:hypothetical protein
VTSIHQAERIARAEEQFDRYQFRAVQIAGHEAVYVTAPARPGQGRPIYTVRFGGHHAACNCMDYLHRCAGTTARCKHVEMAERFLRSQQPARPALSAERLAEIRRNMAADFPEED